MYVFIVEKDEEGPTCNKIDTFLKQKWLSYFSPKKYSYVSIIRSISFS